MDPIQLPTDSPASRPREALRVAFWIALMYLLFGLLWIIASDWAVERLLPPDVRRLSQFQTLKGTFYIVLTAVLLFLLVRHYIRQLQETQKLMQAQVQHIADQYMQLFQHSPVAMLIFEPTTQRILAANDVCTLVLGYTRTELLGMTALGLLMEEDQARALAMARGPLPEISRQQWKNRRRDGRVIHVETVSRPIDFNGTAARILLLTDVTVRLQTERSLAQYRTQLEQRVTERTVELSQTNLQLRKEVEERQRIEERLRAATAAAEAANDAKSTFLANTSHEIRTPLTSILGYADLLADEALAPENRVKYLDVVRANAQHLLTLIDDLLDLSRAEMGKVRVTFDDNSPREIAQQAMELLRPRTEEKTLALHLEVAHDVPEMVQTDGVRLRQILLNLLSNAVKFTPVGSVTLRLSTSAGEGGMPMLLFEVADTGIGMDQQHLEQVFEPFYQVEQGNTRRFGGFGLGLAISRQLAAQMGGMLSVKSTPGEGSMFTLSLPVQPESGMVPPPHMAHAPAAAGSQLVGHILLAEDTDNIRRLVAEYLTRAGARVTTVAHGAEAVEQVTASLAPGGDGQAPLCFDLVLLDLHMPVLDGRGALAEMRAAGYAGPIVGLSADYTEKSAQEWLGEGWDAMAAKPIDRQAFIPLLASLLATRKNPAQPQA
jgi:PAS domain S-box-containing protein